MLVEHIGTGLGACLGGRPARRTGRPRRSCGWTPHGPDVHLRLDTDGPDVRALAQMLEEGLIVAAVCWAKELRREDLRDE